MISEESIEWGIPWQDKCYEEKIKTQDQWHDYQTKVYYGDIQNRLFSAFINN